MRLLCLRCGSLLSASRERCRHEGAGHSGKVLSSLVVVSSTTSCVSVPVSSLSFSGLGPLCSDCCPERKDS